ncbi:nuclear transport factor 2 family protein [archaeon]|nr:MAG: nuclear transport factor 2 family protein [archaeon]
MVLSSDRAQQFAEDWVAAWNAHDLDRILAHYEEDFEMNSPVIANITGDATGCLRGKEAVRSYWALALDKYPNLRFELLHVLKGVNSVTLVYQGVKDVAAEVFHFSASGRVARAFAHYQTDL